jgi:CO/xanthine dehydrogenase FAD-binding subunit
VSANSAIAHRPLSLDELDSLMSSASGEMTCVAGATDLMVKPEHWKSAANLVDLSRVPELATTLQRDHDGGLLIGAAVPLSRLIRDPMVREHYPLLVEACAQIGSVQIQNRATLGGNIANASPAGDSLPVLSVYDAELHLGPRTGGAFTRCKITDVMRGPGLTSLAGRYLAFIRLPEVEANGQFHYFRKVGQRYSLAISKLSLAVLGWREGDRLRDIRICAGSVSPVVQRAEKTEALLRGQSLTAELILKAARRLSEEVSPISDIRSSESYRRHICGAVLADALHTIHSGELKLK